MKTLGSGLKIRVSVVQFRPPLGTIQPG